MKEADKKRRKEIKQELKRERRRLWKVATEEVDSRIKAAMLAGVEFLVESADGILLDATYFKLSSMADEKEITIIKGSFDDVEDEPIEFVHVKSGQKWEFCSWSNLRIKGCYIKPITKSLEDKR